MRHGSVVCSWKDSNWAPGHCGHMLRHMFDKEVLISQQREPS